MSLRIWSGLLDPMQVAAIEAVSVNIVSALAALLAPVRVKGRPRAFLAPLGSRSRSSLRRGLRCHGRVFEKNCNTNGAVQSQWEPEMSRERAVPMRMEANFEIVAIWIPPGLPVPVSRPACPRVPACLGRGERSAEHVLVQRHGC